MPPSKHPAKLRMLALVAAACGATMPGLVVASGNAAVNMTFVVLTGGSCNFVTPKSASIGFTINPLATITQQATGVLTLRCASIFGPPTAVVGLLGPSSRVLTNTATTSNTISYSISYPGSMSFPRGINTPMTVTAAVSPAAAAAAAAGDYIDTFTITVAP